MATNRNPAPVLTHKRTNLLVSVALFYKRPITVDDVRVINPTWAKDGYRVREAFGRLVKHNYMIETDSGYQLTAFGHDKAMAYASWRAKMNKSRALD